MLYFSEKRTIEQLPIPWWCQVLHSVQSKHSNLFSVFVSFSLTPSIFFPSKYAVQCLWKIKIIISATITISMAFLVCFGTFQRWYKKVYRNAMEFHENLPKWNAFQCKQTCGLDGVKSIKWTQKHQSKRPNVENWIFRNAVHKVY